YLRKQAGHYERLNIRYVQGAVTGVDTAAKTVTLADGGTWGYGKLLLATGAHPIRPPIPGLDRPQVHHCWTLADARRIVELATPGSHVVLLGAGFIGCIILESLFERQVSLNVIEMGDRMVPRMMDENAGGLIKRWCEEKGIAVHTSTRVTEVREGDGPGEGGGDELAVTL
ncbi:MAG: FAD-dependent oxidoreductase, partial [Rhodocyclaceae bacterium]|nr:FAD-dependent oxidoreductase [Rhodocyclaceae bacterium]